MRQLERVGNLGKVDQEGGGDHSERHQDPVFRLEESEQRNAGRDTDSGESGRRMRWRPFA